MIRQVTFGSLVLIGMLGCVERTSSVAQAAPTEKIMLSGNGIDDAVPWDFMITAGRKANVWSKIPVPSNWDTEGFGTYSGGWNFAPTEHGLYKTTFTAPATWNGQSTSIVFDGAMTDTEVKINGVVAGPIHQGGFYRFKYDITPLVRPGQVNTVEVRVTKDSADQSINRAERQGDYWNFGGIYRPVYLESKPAQHIDHTAINAKADGTIAIDVDLKGVTNAQTLTAQVKRLDGVNVGAPFSIPVAPGVARATVAGRVTAPALWTAETPNLYQVEVRLSRAGQEIHRTTNRFGFRTIEVRAGDGIYVNGSKIVLKGAARHSFWPDSGRATSPAISRADVLLMKEMNMNTVRAVHYPPDTHFLEMCDSLGLYVSDELGGWQKKYDTAPATRLVEEMIKRDVNHPSIIMWANANEGGWNTDVDDDFALYDPQKRPVIHPWSLFSNIQTDHYENYESTRQYAAGQKGNNIFFPTEFLHALYDGGAGAGLNDYWKVMKGQRLNAGGIIWALVDEGLVRDDQNGRIDVGGNNYPDGIVGPHREKEASFYTIKEIWSPIQLADAEAFNRSFPVAFNGRVDIQNDYDFLNTNQLRFGWKTLSFNGPNAAQAGHKIIAQGTATSPNIAPDARGTLQLTLPATWRNADALQITVSDPTGREVIAWTRTVKKAADFATRLRDATPLATNAATTTQDANSFVMTAGGTQVSISKATGRLTEIRQNGKAISLSNGPTLATGNATFSNIALTQEGDSQVVQANYSGNLTWVRWRLRGNGWLDLSYRYNLSGTHEFLGVNFDYPEANVRGV
ncbi:MAG TPA: glycoside hydrolase family 2 TIM barrel-domain containing protein, partial [Abditibacterium sp.]